MCLFQTAITVIERMMRVRLRRPWPFCFFVFLSSGLSRVSIVAVVRAMSQSRRVRGGWRRRWLRWTAGRAWLACSGRRAKQTSEESAAAERRQTIPMGSKQGGRESAAQGAAASVPVQWPHTHLHGRAVRAVQLSQLQHERTCPSDSDRSSAVSAAVAVFGPQRTRWRISVGDTRVRTETRSSTG